ncbi:hypothetical protein IMSAGC016_00610 [Muribaculaceae bacterium]|nr:hypothetical protein IMSAGC016_00610 [Muribaculaceae bacterium]
MNVSYIERIIRRGNRDSERILCLKLSYGIHVVVMVTDSVIHRQTFYLLVKKLFVVGKIKIAVIPIKIPCHVTESNSINLASAIRLHIVINILGNTFKLGVVHI